MSIALAFVALTAFCFVNDPTEAVADTPGEWVPVSNITGAEGILHIDANSMDDTLLVCGRMGVSIWGLENHTNVGMAYLMTDGGYTDADWNDLRGLMAWVHRGSSTEDGWDRQIVIFNLDSELIASLLPVPGDTSKDPETVLDVEWRPDGTRLAVVTRGDEVVVYDVSDGSVISRLSFPDTVSRIAWDPTGTFIAVRVSDDQELTDTLHIYDTINNDTWSASPGDMKIYDIDWSHNGSETFLMTENLLLGVDLATREIRTVATIGTDAMAASPREPLIAIHGKEDIRFLDPDTGEIDIQPIGKPLTTMSGWTSDGAYFYVVGTDSVIRIWTRQVPERRPVVGITHPAVDSSVSGVIEIAGWATEGPGDPVSVSVKVGTEDWVLAEGFHDWMLRYDTTYQTDGLVIIRARALDTAGYSEISVARVFVTNHDVPVNQPPETAFTAPADGATVWGITAVTGTASDDVGIVSVQLKFGDRGWRSIEIGEPGPDIGWTLYIEMFTEQQVLAIAVRAYDGSLFSETSIIEVEVRRPDDGGSIPVLEVLQPVMGSMMPPTFNATGRVLEGEVDGIYVSIDRGPLISVVPDDLWSIRFENLTMGPHVLEVMAGSGALYSQRITVYFDVSDSVTNLDNPPLVGITSPPSGSYFLDGFTVRGWSADDYAVSSVEVRINDGEWVMVEGTSEWSITVDRGELSTGWNTVEAHAFDGSQYSVVNVTRVNFTPVEPPEPAEREDTILLIIILAIVVIALIAVIYVRGRQKGV